jgi:hypothetical protein
VGEVVGVEAVRDDGDLLRRAVGVLPQGHLPREVARRDDAVGPLAHRALPALLALLPARVAHVPLPAMEGLRPDVAEIGDPRQAGSALERQGQHLSRVRGGARVDRGDPLLPDDRQAPQECGREPGDLGVGHEDPTPQGVLELGEATAALEPRLAFPEGVRSVIRRTVFRCLSSLRLAPSRSTQAIAERGNARLEMLDLEGRSPIDGDIRGNLGQQALVAQPIVGVAHGVDDRLPSVASEVLDELQSALDAPAPLGRKAVG